MSPAMVDVRTPATDSRVRSQQSRLRNPSTQKGQLPTTSLFSGYSLNPFCEPLNNETNRSSSPNWTSTSGSSFFNGFSTPPPKPPEKAGKKSLSKPRLVKLRRHLAHQRAEPSSSQDAETGVGFNSNPTDSSTRDSTMDEVRERLQGWNPFSSAAGMSGVSLGKPQEPTSDTKTPKPEITCPFKENIHAGLYQNIAFSASKGSTVKERKSKNKRGKLKTRTSPVLQRRFVSTEMSGKKNSKTGSPDYSPMDFSPYQERSASKQFFGEKSVASEGHLKPQVVSGSRCNPIGGDMNEEVSKHVTVSSHASEVRRDDSAICTENESFAFQGEKSEVHTDALTNGAKISDSSSGMLFDSSRAMPDSTFLSEDTGFTGFIFTASPASQGPSLSARRHHRKKNQTTGGSILSSSRRTSKVHLFCSSPQFSLLQLGSGQGQPFQKEDLFTTEKVAVKRSDDGQEYVSAAAAATNLAQDSCEKWRLRGNQAYEKGDLLRAEKCYTQGLAFVSSKQTSRGCERATMLCYSNRAAARMLLGRFREALKDCMLSASIEPTFLRVQLIAANCYLALGETENALKHFKNCLQSGSDPSLLSKIAKEASDGLQKAKQVAELMERCGELLQQRISADAAKALEITARALLISPYSETLIQMKAESFLILGKYKDVVELCEKTMDSAETNDALSGFNSQSDTIDGSNNIRDSSAKLWRYDRISKAYFYLGRLEEALYVLQKHGALESAVEKNGNKNPHSSGSFAVTILALLRHKASGNEAFQNGKHLEAAEHYSAALSLNIECRPFAAVCFCNRAAAYQALGQIADAIADCSIAIALDSNYKKALYRRATLHEMIRDYKQAVNDLQKLLSLLEKQVEKDADKSRLGSSPSCFTDVQQVRKWLARLEEEVKKGIPLNMYLILGVEQAPTAVEIKKAYRRAALKHHPDKASKFLARSENGDAVLWKEVVDEVQKDSDRLFKMIGEAYAVIADPAKRSQYENDEEFRNARKEGSPKATRDAQSSPFDKGGNRKHWRAYANAERRRAEASRYYYGYY